MSFCVMPLNPIKKAVAALVLAGGALGSSLANATTVQIQTVMGDIVVNLYDKATPVTVQNFLSYVESGAYNNTLIHRSVADFIIQGGGYSYTGSLPPTAIERGDTIANEPVYSNVRGTIAMAKVSGYVESATSEWFINTEDNSADLDPYKNGAYTVFGQVISGMDVVDAIQEINRFNMGSPFASIPLLDYSYDDYQNNVPVAGDNFVMVTNVVVLDANPDTADSLSPALNKKSKKSDSGSGSSSFWILGLLALFAGGRWLRRDAQ